MSQPSFRKKRKNAGGSKASLSSLLRYMEGMELIIELKTGRRYRGTLSSADDAMNLGLENPSEEGQETSQNSDTNDMFMMNIRGSNIRCIHFPDNADLKGTVSSGIERERAASNKYKRGKRK